MLTQFETRDSSDRQNFQILKIQNGGGRFEKSKYSNISVLV